MIHFNFFVWGCRRVDVKRKLRYRRSCDRCLSTTLRGKLGSRRSTIKPMPSRQYGRYQGQKESNIRMPPTAVTSSLAASSTIVSPLFSDKATYPPLGVKSSELDLERGQKPWVSTRPRYYEIETDEDDGVPPPTPPPKPREDRLGQVPYPASIPDCIKMDRERSRSPLVPPGQRNNRQDQGGFEQPQRAYSISSYYTSMDDPYW